ncbi:MAG TPA: membrane assembly protein AsmA [Rhodanobacteraceae bacterium]
MHRRTRLILLGTATFVIVVVLAVVAAMYVLLQPARFTNLLRTQAARAGLTLTLSDPASPTLWPQPSLVLHGVTLAADNRPVLVAARARLVLPWHTLLGGPTTITRLELDAPRINLAQVGPVLANVNHDRQSAVAALPRIDAGVRVRNGSLASGGNIVLDDIHLETGPLVPGHVFSLKLTAHTAQNQQTTLTLLMTPHERPGVIDLDNIHITLSGPSAIKLTLDGQASWQGGSNFRLALHGPLAHAGQPPYATVLNLLPASGPTPFLLRFKLDGPGLHADMHLSPGQFIQWWQTINGSQTPTSLPLPPVTGVIQAKQITLGNLDIEGLQMTSGIAPPTSAPAAATSVVKP